MGSSFSELQFKVELGHKVYCSDVNNHTKTMAIGLSNGKILMSTLDTTEFTAMAHNPSAYWVDSPLGQSSQLSAISISNHDSALGVTSCDGRANISTIDQRSIKWQLQNIVTFKCHKIDPGMSGNTSQYKILFPVHAIGFHPEARHSLFTAGGEGNVYFWDSFRKDKIGQINCNNVPVTKAKLSPDGQYLAYATGYDWGQGIQGDKSHKTSVRFHEMKLNEVAAPL